MELVAFVSGSLGSAEQVPLAGIHDRLDPGPVRGVDLGCVYVEEGRLQDAEARHFTWTHGLQVHRILSGVTRV